MSVKSDIAKAKAWIKDKGIKCPACGHDGLDYGGFVCVIPTIPYDSEPEAPVRGRMQPARQSESVTNYMLPTDGAHQELARINCKSCGLAMLFDTDVLGLPVGH